MKATLTLDGVTIPLEERPLDWTAKVVIDGHKYRVIVDLVPLGPAFNASAFGDGAED